jgi:hypothetical protein
MQCTHFTVNTNMNPWTEPMNTTMLFLHPVHKTWQMSSLGNSYIQFCQQCTTVINNSLRKPLTFSTSHLQHTTQSCMCMTHIHLSPFQCLILVEDTAKLITSTLLMWSIPYWQLFHLHATIHSFIYQYINNHPHTHFFHLRMVIYRTLVTWNIRPSLKLST